jgi:hypothetical protein
MKIDLTRNKKCISKHYLLSPYFYELLMYIISRPYSNPTRHFADRKLRLINLR